MSILGGSCSTCGCSSCSECKRTCTNPHTGDPFEVVYTLYSGIVGDEIGNPTDGYLTATGDSDTSDPQDGMDGTGPWYQQVSGTFQLPSGSRYPCWFYVSFWRNNYALGTLTPGQPAPSDALTLNEVKVTNTTASQGNIWGPLGTLLAPGESVTVSSAVPVVTGNGDQSGADPRRAAGTYGVTAECDNKTVIFSVTAKITWNVKLRQHLLYGKVRECYETSACSNCPGGVGSPNTIYVQLSNFSGTLDGGASINGTYAVGRDPLAYQCASYLGTYAMPSSCYAFGLTCGRVTSYISVSNGDGGCGTAADGVTDIWFFGYKRSGYCVSINIQIANAAFSNICGTGTIASGTATWVLQGQGYGAPSESGTVDWLVSA